MAIRGKREEKTSQKGLQKKFLEKKKSKLRRLTQII